MVFPDVKPVAVFAVARHARAGDFRQPVYVVRLDAGDRLYALAYLVGPRLCAEDAVLELCVAPEIDAHVLGNGCKVQEVARRTADDGDAKVLHQHYLLLGVAGACRQHGASKLLRAVVRAEPAGEEAVAVGYLHDVVLSNPVHRHAARNAVGPDCDVFGGLRDAYRLASGPGRAVEAVYLRHRRGGESERIFVAQVGLLHEGELRKVGERHEVARLDALLVAAAAEQRYVLVFVRYQVLQLRKLHPAQLVDWREVRLRYWVHLRFLSFLLQALLGFGGSSDYFLDDWLKRIPPNFVALLGRM